MAKDTSYLDQQLAEINKILDEVDKELQAVSRGIEEVEIETKLLSVEIDYNLDFLE